MLAKANELGLHTGARQENKIANEEVAKGLIVHNALLDCFTNGHLLNDLVT